MKGCSKNPIIEKPKIELYVHVRLQLGTKMNCFAVRVVTEHTYRHTHKIRVNTVILAHMCKEFNRPNS